MAFSESIRTDLLVKARRSCCICHRFRGTNIEVHHIIPLGRGGTDGAENGIPLCFDCHADVEHYSESHPKGTKYSVAELKKHRDRWFASVDSTGVAMAAPTHLEIDKRVAQEIHDHMTVN